ncbi:MAG: MaoC/PaaZ C-terminal domain-containing protein, partial [Chloroflexota bacterium]
LPGALTLLMMQGPWQQLGVLSDTGMGLLGFDKVRFPAPVRLGDTIHVEVELIDKRETSKSDRGLLRWRWTCKNQKDEVTVEMESANLARRKGD